MHERRGQRISAQSQRSAAPSLMLVVIGSWVIGQKAAGIGIREASTLITTDKSRFIPHFIETL